MKKALKLAGVIGDPIAHSRSPSLHGHWLHRYGIDGHYVPLQIATADFAQALRLLPRMGFAGANVTIPHKHDALALADLATPVAQRIGAANTLSFGPDGITADNTDAYGFEQNILATDPNWAPRTAGVLGAGGASRAVIVALLDRGCTQIRVSNRTMDRAVALADEFGTAIVSVPWAERSAMLAQCDCAINTTALGMTGQPPLDLSLDDLPRDALVNDLVYAPLETPLLAAARIRGNRAIDGLGMLLHQAAPGFERWFHVKPMVDEALRQAVLA